MQAVREGDPAGAERIFMTRAEVHEKFRLARRLLGRFRLFASPIYLEFLCGERELPCAAWANPTRNVRGWRAPCYLIADAHCAQLPGVDRRDRLVGVGPGNDPRCEHCLMHCGFEPAAVLAANRRLARHAEDGSLADGVRGPAAARPPARSAGAFHKCAILPRHLPKPPHCVRGIAGGFPSRRSGDMLPGMEPGTVGIMSMATATAPGFPAIREAGGANGISGTWRAITRLRRRPEPTMPFSSTAGGN